MLFLERMLADHDGCAPQMRKPLTYRDALSKHQACGGFLHYLNVLQKIAPSGEFAAMESDLRNQFRFGYLDPDILHSLEATVPPGDAQMVGAFRTDFFFTTFGFVTIESSNLMRVAPLLFDSFPGVQNVFRRNKGRFTSPLKSCS